MNAPGIGPTGELCLRVSAATLVRVLFPHPENGQTMLALERKGTVHPQEGGLVTVTAQPFGGSSRIRRPDALLAQIAGFHFDSERARSEQDFRILIRPRDWDTVRQFCLQQFRAGENAFVEPDPVRELVEEFTDGLSTFLSPDQYRLRTLGILVENQPTATDNIYAAGLPSHRIYSLFEAELLDPALAVLILAKSQSIKDQELEWLALEDYRRGGKGRSNSVLALPLEKITEAYRALTPEQMVEPLQLEGHVLSPHVPAVLDGVSLPNYERVEK